MFAKCRMANLTFRPVVKTVVNSPFVNVSVFVLVPQMSLCEYPPPMHHRGNIGGGQSVYCFFCLKNAFSRLVLGSSDVHFHYCVNRSFLLNIFSHCRPSCSTLRLLHFLAKNLIFQRHNYYK